MSLMVTFSYPASSIIRFVEARILATFSSLFLTYFLSAIPDSRN
ncbi:MAG: hypothetical protein A4E28_01988 [Methanocella sp. PtaU1.Bin125]|nr:MAG: hypothetical protein A4E28_01988 [Methanocella sp. PtaU1.Bin125]